MLALLVVVLAVACGAGAIVVAVRRRRTPPDLRGDWWTRFEREFRAYVRQQSAGRDRNRRRHWGERA